MDFRLGNLQHLVRRARGLLGVDIGSGAVKILRWRGGCPGEWPEYAIRNLPPGAIVDGSIHDVEAVGACIAEAAGKLRSRRGDAVTAVPGSAVMQRTIEMDAEMSDAEVEAQIIVEADRHIPYPLEEVCIDFCRRAGPETGTGTVLLSICRREHVTSRVQALEQAGLRAAVVDVEHHALERAWRLLRPPQDTARPVAIVDIGAGAVHLHVILDGRVIYGREQPFGIAGSPGQDMALRIAGVAKQVGQSLQLFVSSSGHRQVESVYLTGDVAAAEGLAGSLQEALSIPAQVANPLPTAVDGQVSKDAPALMLAAGLAIPGDRHG